MFFGITNAFYWGMTAASFRPQTDAVYDLGTSALRPKNIFSSMATYASANTTNDSATLADVTGLTVTPTASTKYKVVGVLHMTTGATLEGVIIAIAGTATVTNMVLDVAFETQEATPVLVSKRVTAMAGTADAGALVVNGALTVYIDGVVEINASGTFKLQMAKSVDTGAANNTVLRDSSWILTPVV